MLSQVTKGKIKKPHIVLLYGIDGVGKTSWAAQAPNPIFLGTESGSNNLDVTRFPEPKSWRDVETAVSDLTKDKHEYKTLAIDSADWLEPILHQEICVRHNAKSIELAAGGYGKGYVEAVNEWQKLTKSLARLRDERGMNIIILAHSEVVRFSDPYTQTEYDRYQIKLYKKSSAWLREFSDCVFFANFEIFSKKDGQKQKHFGDGARVIYTERRPGFDAKNRLGLPFAIPLSWEDFETAIAPVTPETLLSAINAMIAEIPDPKLKETVIETVKKAGANVANLEAVKNRLQVRLSQQ